MVAIAAGFNHSLALKKNGSVIAWGCRSASANNGQCRVPATARRGVIAIATSFQHTLALRQDEVVVAGAVSARTTASARAGHGERGRDCNRRRSEP